MAECVDYPIFKLRIKFGYWTLGPFSIIWLSLRSWLRWSVPAELHLPDLVRPGLPLVCTNLAECLGITIRNGTWMDETLNCMEHIQIICRHLPPPVRREISTCKVQFLIHWCYSISQQTSINTTLNYCARFCGKSTPSFTMIQLTLHNVDISIMSKKSAWIITVKSH